jgi:CO/xanthine dehydrogenase FAD-binding subunit
VVDWSRRRVACACGSVGPRPVRDRRAEAALAAEIDWDSRRAHSASAGERFGRSMARTVTPIDDHRATAAYRREATAVLARRAVERALT